MAASVSPISASSLTARLNYLADLLKADDAYAQAWWAQPQSSRRGSGRHTPLRGSFSSDEMPNLDNSSELPSPSSSAPSTPAEYVQEYFEQAQKHRERYDSAWRTAVEKRILCVHDPHDPAIKLKDKARACNLLAAQLDSFAQRERVRNNYYEAWSNPVCRTILAHGPRDPAIKVTSNSTNFDLLAIQLESNVKQHAEDESYDKAWINAEKDGLLMTRWSVNSATVLAQLQAASDEEASERAYADAWSRYGEITRYARAIDAWKSHHLELLKNETEYYDAWFDEAIKPGRAKLARSNLGFSAIDMLHENNEPIKLWTDTMKTTKITPANSLLLSPPSRRRAAPSVPRLKKRGDRDHFMWPEGITNEEKVGLTARGNLQPYLSSLLGKIVSFEFVGQSEFSTPPDQASPSTPMQIVSRANLKCQSDVVCKVKVNISISSPPTAHKYARDPLPLFDALRQFGHAAVIQLDQVGDSPLDPETGRQAIWRKYSVVSGAFRCQVKETFVDRRMFTKDGCDFGKKVLIRDGWVMSPDGVDYVALPL